MITFAIFVWFTMRYVWPPIIKAIEERQKKIADGLAAAEKAHNDLSLSKKKIVEELKRAKKDANAIIDNATKKATLIIEESKEQAKEEGQRIILAAKKEVGHEVSQAKQALQKEISKIVIIGVEKIIEKELDAATQDRLLKNIIQEIK